jgi:hypothetical protein
MGVEIVHPPDNEVEDEPRSAVNANVEYPEGYGIGTILDLIVKHSDSRPQPDEDVKLKVLKHLGTPWRSGCVMIVEYMAGPLIDLIGCKVVLKLLDTVSSQVGTSLM